ncbi:uncharacterized protein LOC141909905 [Tubulanus polymorphus]|uniref:uncharacterized protein LOC141909905 n=1 Tax=Tubulanus polymorphus TaxID=672921 RepID=UPI003DA69643
MDSDKEDKLKKSRGGFKAQVTSRSNKLRAALKLKSGNDEVDKLLMDLTDAWTKFEESHDQYHGLIPEEDVDRVEESFVYFEREEDKYHELRKKAKCYLAFNVVDQKQGQSLTEERSKVMPDAVNKAGSCQSDIDHDRSRSTAVRSEEDLNSLVQNLVKMSLPKPEMPVFSGHPSDYCYFVNAFENLIELKTSCSRERLYYLVQYTRGDVQELIKSYLVNDPDEAYPEARLALKKRFGSNYAIATALVDRIIDGPVIKSEDANALMNLSVQLSSCHNTLREIGFMSKIENPDNLRRIIARLPYDLKKRWHGPRDKKFHGVASLGKQKSCAANSQQVQNVTVTPRSLNPNNSSCFLCKQDHLLSNCLSFKDKLMHDRLAFLRTNNLCFNCFGVHHRARNCRKMPCGVCGYRHNILLHRYAPAPNISPTDNSPTDVAVQQNRTTSSFIKKPHVAVGMPIVPVKVKRMSNDLCVMTYALLDTGSNSTFCSEQLLSDLGCCSSDRRVAHSLFTLNFLDRESVSLVADLRVYDLEENSMLVFNDVYSQPKLPIDRSDIPRQEEIDRWVHLDGVLLSRVDAEVSLIIGSDNSLALEPIEVRSSSRGGPYAVKTIFDWAVNGPLCTKNNRSQPKSCSIKSCSIKSDESLNKQFEVYCNMEFNDLNTNNLSDTSYDDKRALTIMESTVKLTDDGHYKLSLPWKHDKPSLPNNRALAKHRFDLLERRFDKDPKLNVEYTAFVDKMINCRFCELIPDEDLNRNDGLVWYHPHHPVYHPRKNKLRQERVAFMADVEGMFNQVRVTPMCDVLRFLWFSSSHEIVEYRMRVHLFGAASSPSCPNFAIQRSAIDNRDVFGDDVIDTVLRNFYVDDCLKSVCSDESAVDLLSHVIKVLAMGGFRLTQVSSNSRRVLESVPEADRAKTVKDLSFDQLPFEHALGVLWNMDTDEFCFKVNAREDARKTRRGILASVSTLYDPIGFTAPLTLRVKSLLQELCRLKLGWDDPIPDRYGAIWLSWLTDISKIEKLAIERCFKPCEFGEVKSVQLHHFSDASEAGYGSVSYIRLLDDRDRIHCSFVTGKSRFTTIPRLELAAATVSIRLDCIITRELDFDVDKTFYWTDSTSVLKYIRNEDKRFQVFVANRVGVIREHSEPSQWNFVDGKLNPADDASRGLSIDEMNRDCRWLKGPDFLWKTKESWPTQPDLGVVESSDVEVKRSSKACASSCKLDLDNDVLMSYFALFSSWSRLKKSVALILRFKRKLMRRDHGDVSNGPISVGELREAERAILSYVQRRAFPEAFNGSTLKQSSILALSPVEINNLLCVRGRLGRSELSESSKHPIILPKNGHITDLIVRFYHDIYAHRGREYTLSKIRLKFWVVNGKSAVWRTISKCINCRKRNAKLSQQKMSDLPPDRVSPDKPPFSFVGLDYFGPFLVKRGRVREKRYGCIFTCLASRSVHLEVCHSLDTDSFISGLRRFIARRGQPEKIRSDNGTNLVGGQRELKDAINNWNQDKIQEFLLQKEKEWEFTFKYGRCLGKTHYID